MYHSSVGQNCVMELDFAVDRTGNIDPKHAARYREFGAWINSCYATPLAATGGFVNASQLELTVPAGAVVDRVAVGEDLSGGQRILAYTVEAQIDGQHWQPFASGTSVGHKHISLVSKPVNGVSRLRLTVTKSVAAPAIKLAAFAPCPKG